MTTDTTNTERLVEALGIAADTLGEAATYTGSESWSPSMTEAVWLAERVCRAALAEAESAPRDNERWSATNPNSGHGHVNPRPDGFKARCGGPALCAACKSDEAEAEGQAVAQGWQPIETAPKDGCTVLVWPWEGGADTDYWNERTGWLPGVTHWMPLPVPPGAAAPEAPPASVSEPIARVAGYYDGRCVIETLNRAMVMPVGMALYSSAPEITTAPAVGEESDDLTIAYMAGLHEGRRTAHPPAPREPLTDEDVGGLCRTKVNSGKSLTWLCRAVERKLAEKWGVALPVIGTDREGG